MTALWWPGATVYHIYPRSFQDSNGDGIGDLQGIRSRLDYLVWLGVDALWLSPVYPSPMKDFGYDVADYCAIDPIFGSLEDFDALLADAHRLGLKVLLDLVPNHTSDQHPWFLESRSSRDNPRRDWYIWQDARPDGGPPNNWISDMGGSAWQWDEATGQYYYHAFLKEQPDLNWRNPAVQAAMLDVMRFWFERGVDGFRIDVIWHLVKALNFPDNPINPNYSPDMGQMHQVLQLNSTDQPEVLEIAAAMRAVADDYDGRLLLGEIYLPLDRLVRYYGDDGRAGVHLPLNFHLIEVEWTAAALSRLIGDYETLVPASGWPNWVLGNHDRPRIASRLGEKQARVAAMLLLTLRGTPTLYYGDELGMTDAPPPPDKVQDPRELREPGLGLGRDPVRTPMPWSGDPPAAGFTTGVPWLPLGPDWRLRNVEAEADDPHSMLGLYRRLLVLRREHPSLSLGDLALVPAEGNVLAYERLSGTERLCIVLNLASEQAVVTLPAAYHQGLALISTHEEPARLVDGKLYLRPDEAMVLRPGPAQLSENQ